MGRGRVGTPAQGTVGNLGLRVKFPNVWAEISVNENEDTARDQTPTAGNPRLMLQL